MSSLFQFAKGCEVDAALLIHHVQELASKVVRASTLDRRMAGAGRWCNPRCGKDSKLEACPVVKNMLMGDVDGVFGVLTGISGGLGPSALF